MPTSLKFFLLPGLSYHDSLKLQTMSLNKACFPCVDLVRYCVTERKRQSPLIVHPFPLFSCLFLPPSHISLLRAPHLLPPSHISLLKAPHLAGSVPSNCEQITADLRSMPEQHLPLGNLSQQNAVCIIRCQRTMAKECSGLWTISQSLDFLFTILIMPACATAEGDPMPQAESMWDSD